MKKTWKPIIAGIIDVIFGIIALFSVVLLVLFVIILRSIVTSILHIFPLLSMLDRFTPTILHGPELYVLPILMALLGIVSIIGSVYIFKRKIWGLAVTGSICAVFAAVLPAMGLFMMTNLLPLVQILFVQGSDVFKPFPAILAASISVFFAVIALVLVILSKKEFGSPPKVVEPSS